MAIETNDDQRIMSIGRDLSRIDVAIRFGTHAHRDADYKALVLQWLTIAHPLAEMRAQKPPARRVKALALLSHATYAPGDHEGFRRLALSLARDLASHRQRP